VSKVIQSDFTRNKNKPYVEDKAAFLSRFVVKSANDHVEPPLHKYGVIIMRTGVIVKNSEFVISVCQKIFDLLK
jgi:hypothetical protein